MENVKEQNGCKVDETMAKTYRLFPSARIFVILLSMFVLTALGGSYGVIYFALVCMVNSTSVHEGLSPDEVSNRSAQSHCRPMDALTEASEGYDGEFAWGRTTQASLLAAQTWGVLVLSVPGGLLADRYGSKMILAVCCFVSVLANAVTPWAASHSVEFLFAVRLIQGLGTCMGWPSVVSLISRWTSKNDSGLMITVTSVGFPAGRLLAVLVSSGFCSSSLRWPFAYYFWALMSAVALLAWLVLYTDNPADCRFVSSRELEYIEENNARKGRGTSGGIRIRQVPWRHALLSPRVLSVYLCCFGNMWVMQYISGFMPLYSKEVLGMDLSMNGLANSAPQLVQIVARMIAGPAADRLTFGGRSRTFGVKAFTTVAVGGAALCFLWLTFVTCDQSAGAVVAFCLAGAFMSFGYGGYMRGQLLIAPRYSGLIAAVTNTSVSLAGIAMPYAVVAIIDNGTMHEWRVSFIVTTVMLVIICAQYLFLGTAEEQAWAKEDWKKNTNIVAPATSTTDLPEKVKENFDDDVDENLRVHCGKF